MNNFKNNNSVIAEKTRFSITDLMVNDNHTSLTDQIFAGLQADQMFIQSKFFYDDAGSDLFEHITSLPEYYPTRTEKSIMKGMLPGQFNDLRDTAIIELGSGDCSKISILFDSIKPENHCSITYMPVDFSRAALEKAITSLNERYPDIRVEPYIADFQKHLEKIATKESALYCFFGSTIGNLSREEANIFIGRVGRLMKDGDRLLIGLDMVKDKALLEKAYNDSSGITEKFNKNILFNINRLTGTSFNPSDFDHLAFFNDEELRIEMHLVAKRDLVVDNGNGISVQMRKGNTIHTENSHKFTIQHIRDLAARGSLDIEKLFSDTGGLFTLALFRK